MVLPFEFVALETCLEAACTQRDWRKKLIQLWISSVQRLVLDSKYFESRTCSPNQKSFGCYIRTCPEGNPLNWDFIAFLRGSTEHATDQRFTQNVRDEIEHLVDDDEDMVEMYLTDN
ncbi:hypothetical protein RchiOBHm_Chr6g0252501 [Rosa chinensis]|uniref:Uncharacterized protein n=1 Tax=Rosa chinensis TaxID=74649 RepID=A0A2P6PL41_ROSCH|nr:hypothetical protein RchiOBHm_Chr6g0252501 [Rosa chinensis]